MEYVSIPTDFRPASDLLHERVIAITGAGDGIGRALALACARHGATVVLIGRTIAKLEAVYDSIEEAGGPQPAIYPIQLATATQRDYEEAADRLGEAFGRLDGLVHNAAELGILSPVHMIDPESWYRALQVNLNAPFLITRAWLPLLSRSSDASMIFTTDAVAREGKPFWGAYGVSKRAIEAFADILAHECAGQSPVRVNVVEPAPARTRLRSRAWPAEDTSNLATPEALVNTWLYLLGPGSSGENGKIWRAAIS